MWTVAVSVRCVGVDANAFRTVPVEVIVQFDVVVSSHPHIVVVPPSYDHVYGAHVLPSSGVPVGLAGGLAQSAGWYEPCGCRRCGSNALLLPRIDEALLIPASASVYAETRPRERSELREVHDAASITVTTVMLKTTVTASAITSAKPCSLAMTRRRRFTSGPRAVAQVDGIGQLVRVDGLAALDADLEIHCQVLEAATASG